MKKKEKKTMDKKEKKIVSLKPFLLEWAEECWQFAEEQQELATTRALMEKATNILTFVERSYCIRQALKSKKFGLYSSLIK